MYTVASHQGYRLRGTQQTHTHIFGADMCSGGNQLEYIQMEPLPVKTKCNKNFNMLKSM